MVRMGRGNESLLVPFVDSKGNFGKAYSRDMSCAAARYTCLLYTSHVQIIQILCAVLSDMLLAACQIVAQQDIEHLRSLHHIGGHYFNKAVSYTHLPERLRTLREPKMVLYLWYFIPALMVQAR